MFVGYFLNNYLRRPYVLLAENWIARRARVTRGVAVSTYHIDIWATEWLLLIRHEYCDCSACSASSFPGCGNRLSWKCQQCCAPVPWSTTRVNHPCSVCFRGHTAHGVHNGLGKIINSTQIDTLKSKVLRL